MSSTPDTTSLRPFDPSDAVNLVADDDFVPLAATYPFEPQPPLSYWSPDNHAALPATTSQHDATMPTVPTVPCTNTPPEHPFGPYHSATDPQDFHRGSNHPMLASLYAESLSGAGIPTFASCDPVPLWWTESSAHDQLGTQHSIQNSPSGPIDTAVPLVAASMGPTTTCSVPHPALHIAPETQLANLNTSPGPDDDPHETRTRERRRHSVQGFRQVPAAATERGQPLTTPTTSNSPTSIPSWAPSPRRASTEMIEPSSDAFALNHRSSVRARAALRYRAKTHMRLATLEMAEQEAGMQNQALRAYADRLRQEVFQLKNELLQQSTCDCPLIRGYLVQESERVFSTIRKRSHGVIDPGGPSGSDNDAADVGPALDYPMVDWEGAEEIG